MWFVPTKKEVQKEFEKIKLAFNERDETIKELKAKVENMSLKVATIEGAYLVKSQSQKSVSVLGKSHKTIETKILTNIRKSKKPAIFAEMLKLMDTHTALEMYNRIVVELGFCSKASFYRYYASLKNQKLTNNSQDNITKIQ